MHHTRASHGDTGPGAASHIAVGLGCVRCRLLVAHADVGNAFLLCGCGDRGDRKPDNSEQMIVALLFRVLCYRVTAVDFAHAFLLLVLGLPRLRTEDGHWKGGCLRSSAMVS